MRRILATAAAAVAFTPAADVAPADASVMPLARCIVRKESTTPRYPRGGDPRAVNGSHEGIAQWSPEAWGRHGGRRFAGRPLTASAGQQWQVLLSALRRFGCRDWCPFDGC